MARRLLQQVAEIAALNASRRFKVRVFSGTECDILPDGSLDFEDAVLAKLDYVVASVHSSFSQEESVMTARIVRAVENPRTTMLGHLTGRILLEREPYREPGARSRFAYRLTPAGRELQVVLAALQQWGDEHLPRPEGPSMLRRVAGTDEPVHVGYIDPDGREVFPDGFAMVPSHAPPGENERLGLKGELTDRST